MKTPMVYWDEENGISKVVITAPDGTNCIGTALCRESDRDMMSEKTGCEIAETRAHIAYLKHMRDHVIKPELKTLKKFLYSINQSKYFKKEDYSNQMLIRAIQRNEEDLAAINTEIQQARSNLSEFMDAKAKFYTKIRDYRKAKIQ